ncbi:family 20 glycosylhydrolase [Wenjunlia tyrosinilytica]|uniref:F5/8 type C domain-containing protein n=1 Tax=Wenjunlia tyrosinilytica TaxID=1544741 RepID=A0A917ZXU2_9ACTN|nr:family 20 glycosylhydrolase [Wenjunlia tyrosinilytica]GGP00627.1 hypothetical protein GCM10012280_69800 [Wenjunlia tyrosinilytica]
MHPIPRSRPLRLLCLLALAVTPWLAAPSATGTAAAAAPASPPVTIPAFAQWSAGSTPYGFTARSRIVVDSAATRHLNGTARQFAADLRELTGRTVTVTAGPRSSARKGDIFLTLASGRPAEGYQLDSSRVLTITGSTSDGVFYGTRSVLQLLHPSRTIPGGTATDAPVTAERSLMIDMAREFYSMSWLKDRVREMAYLKLNTLHLHLTDDQNFRIESDSHPELVSAQHYSKAQIRNLVKFAARHHIDVIPEIDLPGHMSRATAAHPELQLKAADGTVEKGALDLSKPAAYDLTRDLLEEYLPFFPGKDFHLGADEWVPESRIGNFPQLDAYATAHWGQGAKARDVMYAYLDWADEIVRSHGKTMRIWNDQLFPGYQIALDSQIIVDHWTHKTGFKTPQELLADGHKLVNSNWQKLYYSPLYIHSDPAAIYEKFTVSSFMGDQTATPVSGTQYSIWGEVPAGLENENQIAYGTHNSLRSFTQLAWGSQKPVATYDEFVAAINQVGWAPGYAGTDQPWDGVPKATTTMTTDPGHPASNVVDGRIGTSMRASAPSSGSVLKLDLGKPGPLGAVTLRAGAPLDCAVLERSVDGKTWTGIGTVTGQSLVQALVPDSPQARYVRLRITCNKAGALSIAEFRATPQGSAAGALSSSLPAYDGHPLANAVDSDPATFFWGGRSPEQDDYLAIDLGTAKPVSTVKLLMGVPSAPTDYLAHFALETSSDGVTWQQIGEYTDQSEVQATAPAGTTARYVRCRVTAGQGSWMALREFSVQ